MARRTLNRPRAGASALTIAVAALLGIAAAFASLPARAAPPPIAITSPAFEQMHEIPSHYTCDGAGTSPELHWTGVPDGAKSLVLIAVDPDAPDPEAQHRTTWVHWVLYDLPAAAGQLPAGVAPDALPPGTRQGINGWNKTGYGAPCPPSGRHRYFFRLFALDSTLPDMREPDRATLERAMAGHVVGTGVLVGTYAHR